MDEEMDKVNRMLALTSSFHSLISGVAANLDILANASSGGPDAEEMRAASRRLAKLSREMGEQLKEARRELKEGEEWKDGPKASEEWKDGPGQDEGEKTPPALARLQSWMADNPDCTVDTTQRVYNKYGCAVTVRSANGRKGEGTGGTLEEATAAALDDWERQAGGWPGRRRINAGPPGVHGPRREGPGLASASPALPPRRQGTRRTTTTRTVSLSSALRNAAVARHARQQTAHVRRVPRLNSSRRAFHPGRQAKRPAVRRWTRTGTRSVMRGMMR